MSHAPENHPKHSRGNFPQTHDAHMGLSSARWEPLFDALADSVTIYNGEGMLLRMNRAARTLFDVPLKQADAGTSYLSLLKRCLWYDERHRPLSPEQLPLSLLLHGQTAPCQPVSRMVTAVCAKHETSVLFCCSPLCDPQEQLSEVVCLFHELGTSSLQTQDILRAYQAVSTLIEAFLRIPELIDAPGEESVLRLLLRLQPVGAYLVDTIAHTLETEVVMLLALGPAGEVYYVATHGLTAEEHQRCLQINGRFFRTDFLGEKEVDRLSRDESIIMPLDRIRHPFADLPEGPYMILMTPIFLRERETGLLVTYKTGVTRRYSSEEVQLATLVAQLVALVLEYLQACSRAEQPQGKALMQQEINSLTDAFLTSVNHEFRTPLTVVLGNLQLAMRRLRALADQMPSPPASSPQKIAAIERPLAQATQGARTLERLLVTIIDTVRIQQGVLTLHPRDVDLGELVTQIVTQQRAHTPASVIDVQIAPGLPRLFADRSALEQVITIYLLNALARTPPGRPVRVQVEPVEAGVRVAITDHGPVLRPAEQHAVWKRFTRLRTAAPVHELDWSLGLGLYLCRELIQRHGGEVGVQSVAREGTTFWLTLPVGETMYVSMRLASTTDREDERASSKRSCDDHP